MSGLTQVQIHYVKDIFNHRLRFGTPVETIKLDKYRRLALFKPAMTFGYIRWRGNKYGTQDWRVYVLQTGTQGKMTRVPGIEPAAKVLLAIHGKARVKRGLEIIDGLERSAKDGLESVPISYWPRVQTSILNRTALRAMPRHYLNCEPGHVS